MSTVTTLYPPQRVAPPASDEVALKQKKADAGIWLAIRSFIWDTDTYLKSPEERRLLLKLDLCILPCLCLGYFCKYLDQTNLTNAYVSGLKEDLGWTGNQYTYAVALYTAGYAAMQVPSTLIVQYVRPSLWLAFCEIAWALLTFCQAAVKNTGSMYALRFLVSITESAFFPVGVYLLGSWYTPTELAKRTAIFHFTSAAGAMMSGYIQAGVYTSMSGRYGLEGWQWLYIICGIITVPCGLLVLILLPDYPEKGQKRWYLTEAEFELAQERMARVGRGSNGKLDRTTLTRILKRWHIWVIPITYTFYGLGCADGGYIAIWLKSTKKYSVQKVNIIPTILNVIQSVGVVLWGFLADYTGKRYLVIAGVTILSILPTGILAAWPGSHQLILAAFLITGLQYITAVYFAWFQEICQKDPAERAVIVSLSIGLQYGMSAWVTILIFPQTESPSFRKGFPTTLAFVLMGLILATLVHYLYQRDIKRGYYENNAIQGSPLDKSDDIIQGEQEEGQYYDQKTDQGDLPIVPSLDDNLAHKRKAELSTA
ncbi:uncharacterized protein I206_106923 [Kwoniella pini CBS 10737]|uniref:Major facilitator superfamily (MFS) profile domain-containing protein n=1 Tax=Kwoniella pini CBS 10737 TaxID=1296096 RepID=A0A1B9HZQ3_9TREE|nr:uncharacterized protein I206_05533 [Kwoniella pini CBS 10737]OCF48752.1 hypothetical protein I206_05533 [Kwoniella pini CBS 10737]